MSEKLTTLTCASFVEVLASKQPVPGGGGAAALAGALSSALCSMVGNYTTGKKRYAEVEQDICRLIAAAGDLSAEFLSLVEKDAEAYALVGAAYGLPREDPARPQAIQEALLAAAQPPLEMVRAAARTLPLLQEMEEKGSVMLVSDVGCAAELCRAAAAAARMNVLVNTASMTDKDQAAQMEAEVDGLLAEVEPACVALSAKVVSRIRKDS